MAASVVGNIAADALQALGLSGTKTFAVLDESELKDGQMKEVEFESGKVLVSKVGGKVYATSAYCTHYGAPLAKGVLTSGGRVTCPWHGACFNVCSGDIEDAPAPASLHKFEASVKDGKIHVTADPSKVTKQNSARAPPTLSKAPATAPETGGIVIVGGGSGAIGTILGLRECGYKGKITMFSREPHAPIDRPKLSKALITNAPSIELFSEPTLVQGMGVHLRIGETVSGVDTEKKNVTVASGEKVNYDKLVLAMGADPRRLPIEGADLPHVYVCRTIADTKKFADAVKPGKRLTVIGSSFIGMELVVAVRQKELESIDVIGMEKYPFQAVLGDEVGAALKKVHESKGVKFHPEAKTTKITKEAVTVEDASGVYELPADIVVMAVGVAPATKFLDESAIKTEKDGGISVDEYLKVKGVEDVYAIGDIAHFPEHTSGINTRIEHWNVAQNHGRAAANNIAGEPKPFKKTPVFWSAQGAQLRYVGHAKEYDEVHIDGNPEESKFLAYYIKNDKVLAVASMGRDPVPMHCGELMALGKMPSASDIKGGKDPLTVPVSSS